FHDRRVAARGGDDDRILVEFGRLGRIGSGLFGERGRRVGRAGEHRRRQKPEPQFGTIRHSFNPPWIWIKVSRSLVGPGSDGSKSEEFGCRSRAYVPRKLGPA